MMTACGSPELSDQVALRLVERTNESLDDKLEIMGKVMWFLPELVELLKSF